MNELLHSPQQQPGLVQIESSRAEQEIQAAMVIAKRFPRDWRAAQDRILNACTRPGLANAAVYQYARGGNDINGPSIRLAETMAANWGNMRSGVLELSRGTKDGKTYSECKAYSWDLETNAYEERIFTASHWRDTKSGGYLVKDERDIYEMVANVGARRKRACILALIPGDITEAALHQCETTMAADADTSLEAQKKIVDAFAKYGVSKEMLEARIQRRLDSITPAQVVALRKIMASLKDGMSKPEEWFTTNVAPPAPDIKKKEKKEKEEKPTASATVGAFWKWCEDKNLHARDVSQWLVNAGILQAADTLLDDAQIPQINLNELLADLSV